MTLCSLVQLMGTLTVARLAFKRGLEVSRNLLLDISSSTGVMGILGEAVVGPLARPFSEGCRNWFSDDEA